MKSPHYDEEAAQKEFNEQTLGNSIYWLKAVIEQGMRVVEATAEPTKHINSENYNSRASMEEQFFLIACKKAHRWTGPMALDIPEAIQFSKLEMTIKNVRDEREHDDERYGLGGKFDISEVDPQEHAKKGFVLKRPGPGKTKPNPHQKFRMEKADTDGGLTFSVSMSCTVHSGGRILLGGIVDVAKVVSASEALIEPLIKEQHAYWDRRVAKTPGSNEDNARIAESYYIEPRFK